MDGGTMTALQAHGFLIGGEWRTDGDTEEVTSPYDRKVAGVVTPARAEHLQQAIEAATRAFQVTRACPSHQRQRVLRDVSQLIERMASRRPQCAPALQCGCRGAALCDRRHDGAEDSNVARGVRVVGSRKQRTVSSL